VSISTHKLQDAQFDADIIRTNDGVLYACENDNPYRSNYLWEIKL